MQSITLHLLSSPHFPPYKAPWIIERSLLRFVKLLQHTSDLRLSRRKSPPAATIHKNTHVRMLLYMIKMIHIQRHMLPLYLQFGHHEDVESSSHRVNVCRCVCVCTHLCCWRSVCVSRCVLSASLSSPCRSHGELEYTECVWALSLAIVTGEKQPDWACSSPRGWHGNGRKRRLSSEVLSESESRDQAGAAAAAVSSLG